MVRKDRPGQLGNRLQVAMIREAAYMIAEGIATAEDIDLAIQNGLGLRFPCLWPADAPGQRGPRPDARRECLREPGPVS